MNGFSFNVLCLDQIILSIVSFGLGNELVHCRFYRPADK